MRRNSLTATILLLLSGASITQTAAQNTPPAKASPASSGQKITANAVWTPGPDFLQNAHKACDNAAQPPRFAECFINQMVKAGAPAPAVSFTRQLYKQNGGDVGIIGGFKDLGPIAMVWVAYPLRANDNAGILFVNGEPDFLDVDNLKNVDTQAAEQTSIYQAWKKSFPNLTLSPGDRAGGPRQVEYARVWGVPGGGPNDQRFLFIYPLLDGCRACARIGVANYWWDFDEHGKFMGTKLASVARAAPPIKRPHQMAPPPGAPTPATPPAQPGTTPTESATPPPK